MKIDVYHLVFSVSLFGMAALRVYYGRKARRERGEVKYKEGRANLAVRIAFGFGYISTLIVYALAPSLFAGTAVSLPNGMRWLGTFITIGSVLLLWWVQWALDVQFDGTLHTQADHRLIQHGPYRWVRHPMYSTFLLMGLGWFLLTANGLIGIPLVIGIVLVVLSRIQNEEEVLIDLFGDEYRDYMQITGRFLPVFFRKEGI